MRRFTAAQNKNEFWTPRKHMIISEAKVTFSRLLWDSAHTRDQRYELSMPYIIVI